MNNKDYLARMSERLDMSSKEVAQLTSAFVSEVAEKLDEGRTLTVTGFGAFEVKKKMERIVVNPATRQRMLVPPKLAVSFKAAPALKDKTSR